LLVDVTEEGAILPEIILFYAGEIQNLVGVQVFRLTDIMAELSVKKNKNIAIGEDFTEFIGTAGPSSPYFAACSQFFCYFLSIDILNPQRENTLFLELNSDYPGLE
jgi:hypothetical protein